MRPLPTALVAALLLATATPTLAAPACTGALAHSCAKKLFRCFKPKGACAGELVIGPGGVETTQCWANKAGIHVEATAAGGTVTYTGARGRKCLRGEIVVEGGHAAAFVFRKGRKRWAVREGAEDGLAITCPDGTTETWSREQLNTEPPSCGGWSDASACEAGVCP